VGKLWKGQPAGEENNDTPLHAASRAGNKVEWPHFLSTPRGQPRRKQGGVTSLPVPSTWPAGRKTRWNVLTSCPLYVNSRQETRWNDLTSCPLHVANRQENLVEWPHFLSLPREQLTWPHFNKLELTHFISSAKWPAGLETKLHDVTSCPSTWLARQEKSGEMT